MTPKAPSMTEGKAENLEVSKIEDSLKQVATEKRVLEAETRFAGGASSSGTDITSTKGKKGPKATTKFQQPSMGDALGVGMFVDQVLGLLQDFQPQKPDMLGGGKKNDGKKPKQDKDLMTTTSLNQSKFAAGTARAKLDNLLTVEAKLMEARDNKYLFSPEQLSRLEQGISHLPADLHKEYGLGLNRLEQALDGIKVNNGQKPGVRHPGKKKGLAQASM
ncbi:MAG: hypothetical protein EP349_00860 [Alphaproteobacteria bacterium]|nr:MAG: hypothetical protein EP349_00860 [Alphaproteobacteria bacterium]